MPKDREIVAKAAQEAMAWNKKEARKGLEGSTEAIDMLKSKGMEVVVLSPKDMATFKAKTTTGLRQMDQRKSDADWSRTAEKIVKSSAKGTIRKQRFLSPSTGEVRW